MSSSPQHRNRASVLEALRHAASTFASHRALVLLLRSVKYFVAAFIILCIADAVAHFAADTRLGLILLWGGIALLLGMIGLVIACFARPKADEMAQILEKREGKLGSKLTNILELHGQAEDDQLAPLTRDLAQQAVTDATREVDTSELATIAKAPFLKRESKRAALVAVLFALLPLLLGEPGRRQFLRFLQPHGDHPPLSFTWLQITKPVHDGLEIVYGEDTRVEVSVKGHLPKELVLTAEPVEGDGPAKKIPMTTRGDGLFVAVLENIEQPLRLAALTTNERSRSKHRHLDVLLNPRIEDAWVTVTPPAYTGLPPHEKPFRFAGIQALEGSELTFRLQSNRPLGKGTLVATPTEGAPVEVPLQPAPGDKKNHALAKLVVSQSGRLHFQVRDEGNRAAEDETSSSLTVSQDLPPSLSFLSPQEDSFVVDSHEFEIEISASDDYGLRTMRILPAVGENHLSPIEETLPGIGPKRHNLKSTVRLADLGAQPGDIVTFFAEAIDNCPDPHLTRTKMRRLEVISEQQYQEFLRKQADVAQIAGAYEGLLDRLSSAVQRQEELAQEMAELANAAEERELTPEEKERQEQLQQAQEQLNRELREVAQGMEEMARQTPVYDFEDRLHEQLQQMAQKIEQSVAQNEQSTSPNSSPSEMAKAAAEQHDRLAQNQQQGEDEIREPLQDLATMHELIKDINHFMALYEEQQTLAEQTARFEQTTDLSSADRMSLKEMAGRQREVASALQQLQEDLKRHADAAEEDFPKAAQSARDLAEAIGDDNLPGLGRTSSQSMLRGEGNDSHSQATHLKEEMEKYLSECGSCQGSGQSELDQYLQMAMGSQPGQNFQQMMDSLCFGMGKQGGSGMGSGGSMATGIMPGQQMGLMGGRALIQGPIGRALAGGPGSQGRFGTPGTEVAKVDGTEADRGSTHSTRSTSTPESQGLLQEYQNLTEAYFRTLTQSKDESAP
ncbi:DUF4175 family protein [Roseibacillus persicicus]|uniref:DUF4175 family protein n=1 Tax=Roseibacillus persicicus TaxID=454148 RepID=UPI00280E6B91|nr:DUF4175 family protein [Roseibacillus persicicus]MDQ8190734.1 DUF4175 family protein [Roseibacillus persicicus]